MPSSLVSKIRKGSSSFSSSPGVATPGLVLANRPETAYPCYGEAECEGRPMLWRRIFLAILVLVGFALATAPSSAQPRAAAVPGFRVLPTLPGQSRFFQFNHWQTNLV